MIHLLIRVSQIVKKKCTDKCKNQGRRIRAYSYYVDKNFEELTKLYNIFGGLSNGREINLVEYIPNIAAYKGILIFKKK